VFCGYDIIQLFSVAFFVVTAVSNFEIRLDINGKINTLYRDVKTHVFLQDLYDLCNYPRPPLKDLPTPWSTTFN